MLSSGANVIIWDEMLSSGMKCYHLERMLSSGANVIIWDKMISCGANVVMLSFGANVIIWCYHVMLSSGMITPPFFIFPGNFTHSLKMGNKDDQSFYPLCFSLLTTPISQKRDILQHSVSEDPRYLY